MQSRTGMHFWVYFFAMAPWLLLWISLKHRIDLISVGSPLYAVLSGPAKLFSRAPMLTFIFITPISTAKWKMQYRLLKRVENAFERVGLAFSNTLLANSWGARDAWVKQYKKNTIEVFPNNVEDPPFDKPTQRRKILNEFQLPENAFLISTSGVLVKRKNHDCLIRALARVKDSRVVGFIVGEGPRKKELKELAQKEGVEDRIFFTGYRSDAVDLIRGTDLFAFPSYAEGMAESLLEATTCHVPCLVSSIPENMDVVRNPQQHFPADHPEVLAEQIQRLIDDPALYKQALESTLEDKKRFVFDWKGRFVQKVKPLIGLNGHSE
jgi:glycosyltransferase involved in cell wall biosynthesis